MKLPFLPGREGAPKDGSWPALLFVLIFFLLAAGIITVGYISYKSYEWQYVSEAEKQLSAIAELKVSELTRWREERLRDGNIFFKNPSFSALVRRFFAQPADTDAQRQLLDWLGEFPASHGYDRLRLLDAQGVTHLSLPDGRLNPSTSNVLRTAAEVLRSGQVTLRDFYRHEGDPGIYMQLMIPILDELDANRPLGVLILRIDPTAYLYPFISRWPVPSATAETLLVRREGNAAVFLNQLRFQTNTALNLRIPLDRVEVPAVQAALGKKGVMKGIDYRGVPVIADIRPVPGSPWGMVARRDIAEVVAETRARLWQTLIMIVSLLFGAAAGVALVWRQQRVGFYREKAKAAETLRESEFRLKQAQQVARMGHYKLNVREGSWTSSEMLDNLFGIDASYPRNIASWAQLLHPEDRKDTLAYFLNHVVMGNHPFDREYRIIRAKDGTTRWVHGLGQLRCNAEGDVIEMFGIIQDITEHKRAEKVILRERNFSQAALDSMPGLFYLFDEQGQFLRVNKNFEHVSGYSADELSRMTPQNLFDGTDWPRIADAIRQVFQTGEATVEADFLAKDQTKTPYFFTGKRVQFDQKPCVIGMGMDITQRMITQQNLEESRQFLRTVIDSIPVRVFWKDRNSTFLGCNLPLANDAGLGHPEELVGKNDFDMAWTKEQSEAFRADDLAVIESGIPKLDFEEPQTRPDGSLNWLRTNKIPLKNIHGEIIGVIGTYEDITERKRAEDHLVAVMENLRASNQDLEQFAYVASHDLQEPLRMVSSYVQLLERRYKDKLDQDANDFIDFAVDGTVRMQQLIDSLLEYSRLQVRKNPFEDVDLEPVLKQVLHDLEGRVLETGARITADPLPHVYGDALQLGLVFQNLIGNALKFHGEKAPEVHIAAEEFSKHWKITVRDNGIGIAPEYQERIFKIFQRLHSRAEYPGTGIGLAVFRRIIERHGGEAGVRSECGKGSSFWFTLPKEGGK